jgi:hypothetical protein
MRRFREDTRPRTSRVHAIGDIHGMYEVMLRSLRAQGLVDDKGNWAGASDTLVFTGDFMDRGPDGIETLRKVKELQEQAAAKGGEVIPLLGNHDIYFFGIARLLAEQPKILKAVQGLKGPTSKEIFNNNAVISGRRHSSTTSDAMSDAMNKEFRRAVEAVSPTGADPKVDRLKDAIGWMSNANGMNIDEVIALASDKDLLKWCLNMPAMVKRGGMPAMVKRGGMPAMVKRGGILFQNVNASQPYQHVLTKVGDSSFEKPDKVEEVNARIKKAMQTTDIGGIETLFGWFTDSWDSREWEFGKDNITEKKVNKHLQTFAPDARQVAHGHTQHDGDRPVEYGNGKALNLDMACTTTVPENLGKSGSHRTTSTNLNPHRRLALMCCHAWPCGKAPIHYPMSSIGTCGLLALLLASELWRQVNLACLV